MASRIYRILRARLSSGSGPAHDDSGRDSHRAAPRRPPASEAGRDPELAGYYANLELPYGAGLEEVEQAWKRLLRKYHPDLHSRDAEKQRVATEIVKGLNRAYEQIKKREGR